MTKEELKEAMNISPQDSLPFEFKIKNNTSITLKEVSLFNPNYKNQSDVTYGDTSHYHTEINSYQDFLDAMAKFDCTEPFCNIGMIAISVEGPLNAEEMNAQLKSEIALSPFDSSSPKVILTFDTPDRNVLLMGGSTMTINNTFFPLSKKSDLIFSQLLPNTELIISLYQLFNVSK